MTILRVYLTNLAAYNRGELLGKWIELPMDEDELQEEIREVLAMGEPGDEEYFITDYETEFEIEVHEYSNVDQLNETAEELERVVEEHGEEVVKAIFAAVGDTDEALNVLREGDFSVVTDIHNAKDLGYWAVDKWLFGEIPDHLADYIDYKRIGEDMLLDGWYLVRELGIAVCIY